MEKRIVKRIERPRGDVFLRADFDDLGDYDEVGPALRMIVREGCLVRIEQGLYARAKASLGSGQPIPVRGLATLRESLSPVGIETVPTRLEHAYNTGQTTQAVSGVRSVMVG